MKRLKKNNELLEKRKGYFRLSDEDILANFMKNDVKENKLTISKKEELSKKEEIVSQDTMAYRINKSSFFLEILKEKEDGLQLVSN
ncbi:MAG: hypothetical protein ACRDD2_01825 [Sarcina sp.]